MHLHIYQADCEWINNTESVIKNKNLKVLKAKQTEKNAKQYLTPSPTQLTIYE